MLDVAIYKGSRRFVDDIIKDLEKRIDVLEAAHQSAGANETTLRVLSSHAIRKHEGVTIFGDPAQVLKVMAAIEAGAATGQEAGTSLYADKYACGTAWMLGGRKSNTSAQTEQWNEPCKQCSTPRACQHDGCRADATQPAESKRVELTVEEIESVARQFAIRPRTLRGVLLTIERMKLARASAKGE